MTGSIGGGRAHGARGTLVERALNVGLALMAGLALATALAGCGSSPGYPPGCTMNSGVRPETKARLESAAGRFYGLLRARLYDRAFDEACESMRTRDSREQMTESWAHLVEVLSIPNELKTEEVVVAVFPPGTRGPQQLDCADPSDPTGARRMLTTDQPYQAYLIQTGQVAGQTYNFGSVWFYEKGRFPGQGEWRLSSVGVRPRLALGQDWAYWHGKAREQLAKGNARNAALLYNLTMDLVVPAPWVRPARLDSLSREQRRIHTEDLPFGRVLHWKHSTGLEFRPYHATAEIGANGLILMLSYEVAAPVDTALVAQQAPLLADFIRTTFPEYPETFHEMGLQATTTVDHVPVWGGFFPFTPER